MSRALQVPRQLSGRWSRTIGEGAKAAPRRGRPTNTKWYAISRSGSVELLFLGRAGERRRRRCAAGDYLRDLIEVAGADLALVLGRAVAELLHGELALL